MNILVYDYMLKEEVLILSHKIETSNHENECGVHSNSIKTIFMPKVEIQKPQRKNSERYHGMQQYEHCKN